MIDYILPNLVSFNDSDNGNLRMLSWKLFSDITTLFLDKEDTETSRKSSDQLLEDDLLKAGTQPANYR